MFPIGQQGNIKLMVIFSLLWLKSTGYEMAGNMNILQEPLIYVLATFYLKQLTKNIDYTFNHILVLQKIAFLHASSFTCFLRLKNWSLFSGNKGRDGKKLPDAGLYTVPNWYVSVGIRNPDVSGFL